MCLTIVHIETASEINFEIIYPWKYVIKKASSLPVLIFIIEGWSLTVLSQSENTGNQTNPKVESISFVASKENWKDSFYSHKNYLRMVQYSPFTNIYIFL